MEHKILKCMSCHKSMGCYSLETKFYCHICPVYNTCVRSNIENYFDSMFDDDVCIDCLNVETSYQQ